MALLRVHSVLSGYADTPAVAELTPLGCKRVAIQAAADWPSLERLLCGEVATCLGGRAAPDALGALRALLAAPSAVIVVRGIAPDASPLPVCKLFEFAARAVASGKHQTTLTLVLEGWADVHVAAPMLGINAVVVPLVGHIPAPREPRAPHAHALVDAAGAPHDAPGQGALLARSVSGSEELAALLLRVAHGEPIIMALQPQSQSQPQSQPPRSQPPQPPQPQRRAAPAAPAPAPVRPATARVAAATAAGAGKVSNAKSWADDDEDAEPFPPATAAPPVHAPRAEPVAPPTPEPAARQQTPSLQPEVPDVELAAATAASVEDESWVTIETKKRKPRAAGDGGAGGGARGGARGGDGRARGAAPADWRGAGADRTERLPRDGAQRSAGREFAQRDVAAVGSRAERAEGGRRPPRAGDEAATRRNGAPASAGGPAGGGPAGGDPAGGGPAGGGPAGGGPAGGGPAGGGPAGGGPAGGGPAGGPRMGARNAGGPPPSTAMPASKEPPPPLSAFYDFENGFIFGCKKETCGESERRSLLGLPINHLKMVERIEEGKTALFIFHYNSRELHALYAPTCAGGLNLEKEAYVEIAKKLNHKHSAGQALYPEGGSPFPAQVRYKPLFRFSPLQEWQWRHIVEYQKYTHHFKFWLEKAQVGALLELFRANHGKPQPARPIRRDDEQHAVAAAAATAPRRDGAGRAGAGVPRQPPAPARAPSAVAAVASPPPTAAAIVAGHASRVAPPAAAVH
ncbi:hypothetical protein KFE25_002198 [Diacronema lutheri]|uniref:DCD domain-containing protein n=2 Tax=Diacronema lutheri TaxID=2081491 RepID=A0A8J5XQD5_DIALT|nr:hypothetical protein KFE25_002198 [Diacronema lutheri]